MTAQTINASQKLVKLAERKRKLEVQYAQEKAKVRTKLRKARTHKLIKLGALFELVALDNTDPAVLLGILDQSHEYVHDSITFQSLKDRGHSVMEERNQTKQRCKANSL